MTAAERMRQSRQHRKDGGVLAKIDLDAASHAADSLFAGCISSGKHLNIR